MNKPRGYKEFCRNVLRQKNVVGAGLGHKEIKARSTDEVSLVVLVSKKEPLNRLKRQDVVPLKFGNFLTDVQEVGVLRFLGLPHEERQKSRRPAPPGISIGHYRSTAGTFGALVRDKSTGQVLILSNNHVMANTSDGRDGRAGRGDPILQPGPFDGGKEADMLARLERFAPLLREESYPACTLSSWLGRLVNLKFLQERRGYRLQLVKLDEKGNLLDAALARPLDTAQVKDEVLGLGRVKGMAEARIEERVFKSGRTTGVTSGRVKVLDASVWVQISANSRVLMQDQLITEVMGQPGDSGSLVLNEKGGAVGLLMAGSEVVTIMNKASHIAALLNIQF